MVSALYCDEIKKLNSKDGPDRIDYLFVQMQSLLRRKNNDHNGKPGLTMEMEMKKFNCFWVILVVICVMRMQCASAAEVKTVAGQAIKPAATLPKTTPWDLKKLSKPPVFKWAEGKEIRSLYFKSEPYKGKETRVFAYYATPGSLSGDPSKDKNLPAVVLVHGGGGQAFDQWVRLWAKRGYAAIAMDLGGAGPKKARLADGGPGQGHDMKFDTIDLPVTEQWSYHAVANVILAHSLIRSFPEVDANRTAITGISWGGYLTCIVAGLDNRFKAAVPVYGCGFLHQNSAWIGIFRKMSIEQRAKWIQLWEPSQYVGSTVMPILFVNGGKDFAYPPDSYAKTYDLVRSPKNIRFVPDLRHGHIFDRPKAIEVFIDHHLKQGVPLARIISLELGSHGANAKLESKTKLVSAQLHYTLDKLPGNPRSRKWLTQAATIKQNKISSKSPPENTQIWFLTVTDERKTLVSSKLMFRIVGDSK
jgi:cephalosporin-C deacetylase-like acetyl esterase